MRRVSIVAMNTLALLVLNLAAVQVALALSAEERREVITSFADRLAQEYVIPEMGQAMSSLVMSKLAAGKYDELSAPELAITLQRDARAISQDVHLWVGYSPFAPPPGPAPPQGQPFSPASKQNGMVVKTRILDGNVGYLRLDEFVDPAAALGPLTGAFQFLRDTDALIIDARYNGGGDARGVAQLISFLSEVAPYLLNRVHYRRGRIDDIYTVPIQGGYGSARPLFVLTSRDTFSGGEELAYDVQALDRGKVVGERTRGGANFAVPTPLPHGFMTAVPYAQSLNPITGENWERVGVSPDVNVPAKQALIQAHHLALLAAQAGASNERERAYFEGPLLKLELEQERHPANSLPQTRLARTYAPISGGAPAQISISGSRLILSTPGAPAAELLKVAPNRYQLKAMPRNTATFTVRDGRLLLLLERPGEIRLLGER